ncbi:hypothetical protein [Arcicella lustrica]|uniref:Uncharacterized protein n=1 Tax=Arcicella lustrica TaxID=2984196 RepID=A0ABU5SFL3_9BACT|nr:hypothetical protein [Arcicella sp. DC25W]MEA5426060.1 hypothetical protein [Arcicella sp. DC25W]
MKKYINYAILIFAAITISYSCTPPLEGVQFKFPDAVTGSSIIVQYSQANDNVGEVPNTMNVRIGGKDSSKVVDSFNKKVYKPKNGIMILALKPGTVASAASPIKFSIITESEGYLKEITPIEITSNDEQKVIIKITKIATPPEGTTVIQKAEDADNTGKTTKAIQITTPALAGSSHNATLSINAGITIKDAVGSPVAGKLNVVLVQVDPKKSSVIVNKQQAGMKVVDKNDNAIPNFSINPISAVSAEISNESSQKVKTFSAPIEIKFQFGVGTKNSAGQDIKEGDVLSFASYDEDAKTLKYEGTSTVKKNGNVLEFVASVNHLTEFYCGDLLSECSNLKLNVLSDPLYVGETIHTTVVDNSGRVLFNESHGLGTTLNCKLFVQGQIGGNAPTSSNITVTTKSITGKTLFTKTLNISCANVNAVTNVDVALISPINYVKITINPKCDNGFAFKIGDVQAAADLKDGKGYTSIGVLKATADNKLVAQSTLLNRGEKYNFMFNLGGIWYYQNDLWIDNSAELNSNFSLPSFLCK